MVIVGLVELLKHRHYLFLAYWSNIVLLMQEGQSDVFEDIVDAVFTGSEGCEVDALAHEGAPSFELVGLPIDALREAFHGLCDDRAIGQDPEFLGLAVGELLPLVAEELCMHDHVQIDEPSVVVYLWGPRPLPAGVSISGNFAGFMPGETYHFESDMLPTSTGQYNGLYIALENAVIVNDLGKRVELRGAQVLISDGGEKVSRVVLKD